MKTEITYPNGLKIVIEHPDLLEAVETKETIETIAALTAENNALQHELEKVQEASIKRYHENNALKQQVSNLESDIERLTSNKKEPGVFEFKGTGGVQKQYTGTIDQITPLKSVTPIKKQREYRSKNCIKCGNSFIPTSARGNICNNCKTEPIAPTETKDLPE